MAITQAQHKKDSFDTEAATLLAANDEALAKSEACAKVLTDSKAGVADLKAALKNAQSFSYKVVFQVVVIALLLTCVCNANATVYMRRFRFAYNL